MHYKRNNELKKHNVDYVSAVCWTRLSELNVSSAIGTIPLSVPSAIGIENL